MPKAVDYKNDFVIENVPVEQITAHPENPKIHPQRQLEAIDSSIQEFGVLMPWLFNRRSGRLLDGHGRFQTEGNRGRKVFPCRVVDVDAATERRIIASLDRTGELRSYDDAALTALLTACREDEGVLPGWSEDDLDDLLRPAPELKAPKVAATEVSERTAPAGDAAPTTAELPSVANGAGGSAEGAAPKDVRQPAQVRMVQLFFSAEEHQEFEGLVETLAREFETNTPSDVVLEALRREASGL